MYMIIDKQGEDLMSDPQKSLPSLLVMVDGLFSDLEASIAKVHSATSQVTIKICLCFISKDQTMLYYHLTYWILFIFFSKKDVSETPYMQTVKETFSWKFLGAEDFGYTSILAVNLLIYPMLIACR